MKTRNIYIALLLGALFISTFGYAQETVLASTAVPQDGTAPAEEKEEEGPTFSLSGSIDTYFRSNFGITNMYPFDEGGNPSGLPAPLTAFSDLKGFGLGMANIIASYEGEKVGFVADLVFGPRGRAAVFASEQGIINQMYAYYKLSDAVTLNLGHFNTFLGYEVISPAVNFHYSTSYMFSYGPFSHAGLRADIDLGNGLGLKLAVMNPTDFVEFNPVNTYTFGGQIGKTTDAGGVWLNVVYGDQDGTLEKDKSAPGEFSAGSLFQVDLTTGWDLSEKFYLGLNTSMQSVAAGEFADEVTGDIKDADGDASTFFGVALYPKITLSESFALGLRAEYFGVTQGHLGIFGTDAKGKGSVTEITLSANYKVGGLTFIPEFRIDSTSEDSFMDKDGKATNMMPSLNLAAVYKF